MGYKITSEVLGSRISHQRLCMVQRLALGQQALPECVALPRASSIGSMLPRACRTVRVIGKVTQQAAAHVDLTASACTSIVTKCAPGAMCDAMSAASMRMVPLPHMGSTMTAPAATWWHSARRSIRSVVNFGLGHSFALAGGC